MRDVRRYCKPLPILHQPLVQILDRIEARSAPLLNRHIITPRRTDFSSINFQENKMLTSVEGIYRDGRIEFKESPTDVPEGALVIVTFINSTDIDLKSQGIGREQAEALRSSLSTFADDWDSPEMSVYDNYDSLPTSAIDAALKHTLNL
jgi:hypothetical protein